MDDGLAPEPLWRIGPSDEPLDWPRWEFAGPDLTFGNRWDDPEGIYRVLYTSAKRLGCFLEVLAFYRADPLVESGMAEIIENEDLPVTRPAGHLGPEWIRARKVGRLKIDMGSFARIGAVASMALMDRELSSLLIEYGYSQMDAAVIRQKAPRRFTQRISRFVFESTGQQGALFAGICYLSRHGDDVDNYALFEGPDRSSLTKLLEEEITWDDPDLLQGAEMHRVTLDEV